MFGLGEGATLNFATVARLRGPIDSGKIRRGLDTATARHPWLRTRIELRGAVPHFVFDDTPPVLLRLAEIVDDGWIDEVQGELREAIDHRRGPLIRAALLTAGEDDGWLVLTFHHVIGDGWSGVYLMRDVLAAAFGEAGSEAPVRFGRRRPMDETLPMEARGLSGLLRRAAFGTRAAWSLLTDGRPVELAVDQEVEPADRRARLIPVTLDEDLTSRLVERARAEQTTVHGALSAAICLGILEDASPGNRGAVVFDTPVDLRERLQPPVGEDIGLYVAMAEFRQHHNKERRFWPLARQIRQRLAADTEARVPESVLVFLSNFFRACGGLADDPADVIARFSMRASTTASLSNLGRVTIPHRYGPVEVEALHFGVSPSGLGYFPVTAAAWRGRIYWNFIWPEPCLTDEHAQRLVDDIVDRLREAVHADR